MLITLPSDRDTSLSVSTSTTTLRNGGFLSLCRHFPCSAFQLLIMYASAFLFFLFFSFPSSLHRRCLQVVIRKAVSSLAVISQLGNDCTFPADDTLILVQEFSLRLGGCARQWASAYQRYVINDAVMNGECFIRKQEAVRAAVGRWMDVCRHSPVAITPLSVGLLSLYFLMCIFGDHHFA